MKLNKSYERAVYVLTILALQKDHTAVKSRVLSGLLQVSDSYLKKILNQLAKAKLITAHATKNGGYQLSKPIDAITLKDVFIALHLDEGMVLSEHLAPRLYPNSAHVTAVEKLVDNTLNRGVTAFLSELECVRLVDLLEDGKWQNGAVDWQQRLKMLGK